MGLLTTIQCDRCRRVTDAGVIWEVGRVIIGSRGEPLSVNDFGDIPGYALCKPCHDGLRAYIDGKAAD